VRELETWCQVLAGVRCVRREIAPVSYKLCRADAFSKCHEGMHCPSFLSWG